MSYQRVFFWEGELGKSLKRLPKLDSTPPRGLPRKAFELTEAPGELFLYEGALEGLKTAVVTFETLEDARQFQPPGTFGYELTFDPRFREEALGSPPPQLPLSADASVTWAFGALPFRQEKAKPELIIITTRNSETPQGAKQWIFPKGQPEKGLSPAQVAVLECLEEAGVRGQVAGPPLLLPFVRENKTDNLVLFPLQAQKIAKTWRESTQRKRDILPLGSVSAPVHGELIVLGAQALRELYL